MKIVSDNVVMMSRMAVRMTVTWFPLELLHGKSYYWTYWG